MTEVWKERMESIASEDELTRIRLVASDLDGTLLLNGAKQPSARAFELIEALVERGVIFLPASGRQFASLKKLFAPIADSLSFLCENGALVMYQDIPVVRRGFSRALALQIARAAVAYPDTHVIASGERHGYVPAGDDAFIDHLRNDMGNDVIPVVSMADIDEPILKVAFKTLHTMQHLARTYFEDEFGQWTSVMTSGTEWTDIVPKGIDKGAALQDFGRLMGIAPQQMAAFGDNENDYGMLTLVGHPYLMKNCNPTMRGVVPGATVTTSVEDELEKLLEHPESLARA